MSAWLKMESPSSSSSNQEAKHSTDDKNLRMDLTKNMLRDCHKANVYKKYDVLQTLGQGSMGSVSKVKIKDDRVGGSAFRTKRKDPIGLVLRKSVVSGQLEEPTSGPMIFALKQIIVDRVSTMFLEELQNEIDILRHLDHPNIVKAYETYSHKRQIFLVLECCDGGDLYTRSPYSELESAKIITSLTSAIKYMHDQNIVHRDLKYENIMFENSSKGAEIKVIDFGLSKKFLNKKGKMYERCGTFYTMAPQVLQGVYSSQADLWSVGVIAFMLLSNTKPFWNRNRRRLIDMILRADFEYTAPTWRCVSDNSKDFIEHLLVVDPVKRYNAAQALKHPWLVERSQCSDKKPPEDILKSVENSVANFRQTNALKKITLNIIARQSKTSEDIMHLRKTFDSIDVDNYGVITLADFKAALQDIMDEQEIEESFSSIDVNQQGLIEYTEFLAATIEARGRIAEDRIAEAFDRSE